jgi:crossover junction endodeoxyribonuclease RuvC
VCNLPVFEYEPTKIKLNLVGVGRADKAQVSFMVGRILGVKPDWASDAGDALAAAVCRLNERRMAKLTQAAGIL